jgi:hypothetical protein
MIAILFLTMILYLLCAVQILRVSYTLFELIPSMRQQPSLCEFAMTGHPVKKFHLSKSNIFYSLKVVIA